MHAFRDRAAAVSLVASPLCILAYWALSPMYGFLKPDAMLRAMTGHADTAAWAAVFAFAGTFLAIPATLALWRLLEGPAPRLAFAGGALTLAGWVALVGVLMTDVLAMQMHARGGEPLLSDADLFARFMNSPFTIALNALVLLHLVGGAILGIALWRTRLVPRWAAVTMAAGQMVHLGANLAGLFWLDAATWLAFAAVGAMVARAILQGEAAPERRRRTGQRTPVVA